jgi:hypothetical protein
MGGHEIICLPGRTPSSLFSQPLGRVPGGEYVAKSLQGLRWQTGCQEAVEDRRIAMIIAAVMPQKNGGKENEGEMDITISGL